MNLRKLPVILAILSLLGLAFGVGYVTYPLLNTPTEPINVSVPEAGESAEPTDQGVYSEVWQILERDFYGEKPDTEARTYGAVRGLAESFQDPYTFFVEPEPREREREQLSGRFGGIGANIELTNDGYLLHPIPDQPASRAGILTATCC
ncbi:MAG: hypothetical protein HC802_10825 [Caldilineaceae bacterium]|nr:hypothetical protein [Caldilineaceae bacterium]